MTEHKGRVVIGRAEQAGRRWAVACREVVVGDANGGASSFSGRRGGRVKQDSVGEDVGVAGQAVAQAEGGGGTIEVGGYCAAGGVQGGSRFGVPGGVCGKGVGMQAG
jgi:hypothetical protein